MQLSQRRREERATESPDGWPSPVKSLQARGQGGGSQRRPCGQEGVGDTDSTPRAAATLSPLAAFTANMESQGWKLALV